MLEGRTIVVGGGQWGDEGKGKITDMLAHDDHVGVVARGNGGDNAGHNIYDPETGVRFDTHSLPSGIFNPNVINVIGQGTVLNPISLAAEIRRLRDETGRELAPGQLFISPRAQVILPSHRWLDAVKDETDKIGTTARGIGPAYRDKASRIGVRAGDLDTDPSRIRKLAKQHMSELDRLGRPDFANDVDWGDELYAAIQQVKCYIHDPVSAIRGALARGKTVIAEGAQGVLLDVNAGTYPFVTSSSTTTAGIVSGIDGLPATSIKESYGVFKLPMTRVGAGPFVTELDDDEAHIQEKLQGVKGELGAEFGATTGRKRDIGWFDGFAGRYGVEMAGFTGAVLTKLDMLDGIDELKVCTGYSYRGKELAQMPSDVAVLQSATPIYQTYEGWDQSTSGIREFADLPREAIRYVLGIQKLLGITVAYIGTGTGRNDIIHRDLR
jgi:adenylosuccinate synthase